jgi:hypothetical protein
MVTKLAFDLDEVLRDGRRRVLLSSCRGSDRAPFGHFDERLEMHEIHHRSKTLGRGEQI